MTLRHAPFSRHDANYFAASGIMLVGGASCLLQAV